MSALRVERILSDPFISEAMAPEEREGYTTLTAGTADLVSLYNSKRFDIGQRQSERFTHR